VYALRGRVGANDVETYATGAGKGSTCEEVQSVSHPGGQCETAGD
jgi:hypothetical protein